MRMHFRTLLLLSSLLVGCTGDDPPPDDPLDGGPTRGTRISVIPSLAPVVQGESIVVRIDVTGTQNQPVAGYSIDLDEQLSRIDIRTAPCPASVGRAACQDWTITPARNAVVGTYHLIVRAAGVT